MSTSWSALDCFSVCADGLLGSIPTPHIIKFKKRGIMKTKYVLGFAFNELRSEVLLILKLRPEWQKGFLNGIGGKIEEDETPIEAMNRECFEETGLNLHWIYKSFMEGTEFKCHIFYDYTDQIYSCQQKEDEILKIYSIFRVLQRDNLLNNLYWLLPFGKHERNEIFMTMNYRKGENS